MFIQLVIVACLAGGAACDEFETLYDRREVSLVTCMMAGQPQVAAWQAAHPAWRVSRWRCEAFDPGRADL